ncbi:CPBP family intramembrane glutamic endopeptidase [Gimesia algae]|uniref:CAAX amino terminal protease self-immunity n=1 Tax=Gimesia algae TaxID=2527971 RepID=A0A517VE45_9PLAN|nr:CPBP family intramembrane glutamic endopeptidase [Gimesia algae]QDT91274.1 CAAX amino terminal protease self- immunity [Gimesia algae]
MADWDEEEDFEETTAPEQQSFILGGSLISIGIIVIAFGVGWGLGVSPLANLNWNWMDLLIGALAALPLYLFFFWTAKLPIKSFQQIQQFLLEELGPRVEHGKVWELFILCIFIGLGEEMLFRGVLQSWATQYGVVAAIIFTNILFGVLHSITRLYVIVATLMGVYMSLLLILFTPQNLLIPVTTHTVYDFMCFMYVMRVYRQQKEAGQPYESE